MTYTEDSARAGVPVSSRLAGGLLVAVGAVNGVFGLLSLLSELVQLSPGVAGGLLVAGVVTAALGVLVWRGSRTATLVSLTVFGVLLVAQLPDLLQGGSAEGVADHPARFALLGLIVAVLALAAVRLSRARSSGARPR